MNTQYEPVIGLEVHVELNTKSKMFCRCSAEYFGAKPNTHTCPICLGLPGALPFINEQAIESCIKIGLALGCSINPVSYFERKNYFYPDLAKGFQTSQLVLPVAVNGSLDVEDSEGIITKIRINRAHQEEDTGKLTHSGSETLIDFNRCGVPLVEIVTEPDFNDPSQVKDYAKKLQLIFRTLGVSNADMERGDMRLEANVSVRPVGQKELPPYRVELKNINSFRFMEQAVKYEIQRQIEAIEKGEKLHQETRGWNEDKKETFVQRSKEEANDYRYFPEPDLPPLHIDQKKVDALKRQMPELPHQRAKRFMDDYQIPKADALILSETLMLSSYFEDAVKLGKLQKVSPKQISNYIINKKVNVETIQPEMVIEQIISAKANQIDDDTAIETMCLEAIVENEKIVDDYKKGKVAAIGALIGSVMRKSQGKANSGKVKEILEKLLNT